MTLVFQRAFNPGGKPGKLEEWIAGNPVGLGEFARMVARETERSGLKSYHLRFTNDRRTGNFVILVFRLPDEVATEPPRKFDVCISCDLENPVSRATLVEETGNARMWLDAQARNKLIVTPKSHVGSFCELTVEQSAGIFEAARRILGVCSIHPTSVISMVANAGNCRNHEHLHLKINVPNIASETWPPGLREKLDAVKSIPVELLRSFIEFNEERFRKITTTTTTLKEDGQPEAKKQCGPI